MGSQLGKRGGFDATVKYRRPSGELTMPTEPVVCATCELHAEAVFRVEGMDCNEEVVILERRLKPLDGMEAIAADLIGQRLHVKYDAAKLTTSAMVDAVGQTGMRMWLEHDEPLVSDSSIRTRWRLMAVAGAALALGAGAALSGQPRVADALWTAGALAGSVFPARRAVAAIRSRTVDINVLMVIAVAGAIALGDLLEAVSVVFLFAAAQWLEARTLERARQAIRALIDLTPRQARVRRGDAEAVVPIDDVTRGDELIVRPGDKVPVDGVVAAGQSDVNEAPVTGESLPVDKSVGDEVYAGSINGRGALEMRVTRVGRDTRLARIIHLVEDAQTQRAPVQTFVDRFARIYTPIVIALALAVALIPAVAGGDPDVWLYRALVLLVIACPCALVISTPVSFVAALSAAARNGVLIKGGAFLERLAQVRTVAFDKTGTLTSGHLIVTDVDGFEVSGADVLRWAASVEQRSEHPVARAIVEHATRADVRLLPVSGFTAHPGMGADAVVAGSRVVIGNERMMRLFDIALSEAALAGAGPGARVFVAHTGRVVGAIRVADRPRAAARDALDLLRAQGVRRIVMLTGDRAESARPVAEALGLDAHHAALLPEEKHARIRALRGDHDTVMMVGDGVNDAPALAAADIGVAMGAAGSDVALETADVALMSDELLKLPYALRLARATVRNVKTNVVVSLALKAAFLVMAVTGSATLWMAVLADTGASVIVVANALRLLRTR
jgi:Cd2+/Zn2+-exporting ATPase